jgi:3-isopropylmalate/(R)-2-methylmalate dehydratase small subunit
MEAVRIITGTAVPLDRSDVDTDQIIPAEWLKRIQRTGFGAGLFSTWRENDRDFVLNRQEHAGASILVAGPNFGVGSSREHAVWALEDYGFKAIVAPRFGDIFRNNCTKVGLVPVVVTPEVGAALMRAVEADPSLEIPQLAHGA